MKRFFALARVALVLSWVTASPAAAQAMDETRLARLVLLQEKLPQVLSEQAKAQRAHDAWINRTVYPEIATKPAGEARRDWREALDTVRAIGAQLYPDAASTEDPAVDGAKPSPADPAGRPDSVKREVRKAAAWRDKALPAIAALVTRMVGEIAALRDQLGLPVPPIE